MSKFSLICFLLILPLLLSGCWSKRELNELAIVLALGIDKVDDEFELSVQVVDPSEISTRKPSTGRTPVITYHAKGETIFEAIRKMTVLAARKPYFSHLRIVVIGEELAKEGINEALDLISRDHEFRNDFDVILSHQASAKDVLNVLTPIEKVPANKMLNSLRVSEKVWGSTISINIDDLVNTLNNNEKSATLSAIEIHGDPKLGMDQTNVKKVKTPVLLKYAGLAVFKKDRYIGLLTEDESRGLSFINDKIESTIEIIACKKGGTLSTEITKSTSKVKGNFKKGSPQINVHIDVEQNVGEVECNMKLSNNKSIKYINKKTEEIIKQQVENTIRTVQQNYQVDVFGFSEVLHRSDAKQWKKIKKDWDTIFPELPIKVEVHVDTQGLGTMQNSLLHKSKKEE
ncbi:Ger(x)C family spore germination protein [Lysinibacillus pakistanensis]|uniref:Ger(x)C family spore germination protein n=1 Tax=Lysinibacillus pakistanensis TaxID=759811 RepID=UPI003D2C43F4